MLYYLSSNNLVDYPQLKSTMFRDRAAQFRDRLNWSVQVDEHGEEKDQYDALNPLYVIWQQADGRHGGSMRFLPTTGTTMVNDVFGALTGGQGVHSPDIWECTRFCLAPDADAQVSSALMLGGVEVGLWFSLSQVVGVFDARMVRIYRRLGWGPTVLGEKGQGRDKVSLGVWQFSAEIHRNLLQKSGISKAQSRRWLRCSLEEQPAFLATG